jgi:DNA (cytosine-5)-methyltransferase 1
MILSKPPSFLDLRPTLKPEGLPSDHSGAGYTLFGLNGSPSQSDALIGGGEWNPDAFLIRAEEHGIPQKRHRVFILGIRNNLVDPNWTPETFALPKSKAPTVHETIGRLPKLWSSLSSPDAERRAWIQARQAGLKAARTDAEPSRKPPGDDRGGRFVEVNMAGVFDPAWYGGDRVGGALNHETRTHIAEDISRYAFAAAFAEREGRSPSIHEFPKRLLPDHRNVLDPDGAVPFADRFRVQLRDQPSTTVTSHISKDASPSGKRPGSRHSLTPTSSRAPAPSSTTRWEMPCHPCWHARSRRS